MIVPKLNRGASQHEYLCGDDVSAADIIIYNELKTILVLHKRELISRETPDLFAWFTRLSRTKEIIEMDQLFLEIVKKY